MRDEMVDFSKFGHIYVPFYLFNIVIYTLAHHTKKHMLSVQYLYGLQGA